ncbi:MAG: heparinase II/III family protein, partial [Ferruginibacter sp.]
MKNMIKNICLLIFFLLIFSISPLYSNAHDSARLFSFNNCYRNYNDTSKNWQQIKTIEDVCNAFPQRMDSLMKEINLNSEGLQSVKAAYENGNLVLACRRLLDYYKNANTVNYLRKECVPSSNERDVGADSILQHILTFYLQTDKVPTNPDGHLNWKYHGPDDDIEWAWALNRHYYFANLLDAWFKTGNTDYANKI